MFSNLIIMMNIGVGQGLSALYQSFTCVLLCVPVVVYGCVCMYV